jgi:pimeloyl-ACP methyl ester carboxylesterase
MRARLNGIEIVFERRGAGPQLLFFNGSGSSIETMGPVIDAFAQHFDVLVHDQRGLGGTDAPPGPYSMADYAADGAALLDHVGWASCRVVGISFGGMVAQEFAVTWPDRVERLALLCTSPGGVGGSSYPLHELTSLPADQQLSTGLRLLDTRFTPEWLDSHPSDRGLAELVARRDGLVSAGGERPDDDRARGARHQLEARRHHDVCDRLGAVHAPTLVASGRYDGIAPVENGAAIVARMPDAEQRVYEGGHAFFVQDPKALAEIMAFLRGE